MKEEKERKGERWRIKIRRINIREIRRRWRKHEKKKNNNKNNKKKDQREKDPQKSKRRILKKGVLGEKRKASEIAERMAFWGHLKPNKQKQAKTKPNQPKKVIGQQKQHQKQQ